MKMLNNVFGSANVVQEEDLVGKVFVSCSACMSMFAEFLSWTNGRGFDRTVKDAQYAENIVVVSCQVTDLAIYNDLMMLEKYRKQYPAKKFFISGCLAQRFDIDLPDGVRRLENLKHDGTYIKDKTLVYFEKPFWIKNFIDSGNDFDNGMFLRNKYPFRIGVGCNGNCEYCTIKHVRGSAYKIESIEEFKMANDMVLIAESPSASQLKFWMNMAIVHGKLIALRNVEPHVVVSIWDDILKFNETGLLTSLHVPVQSSDEDVLRDMKRNVEATKMFLNLIDSLNGPIKATNVIVDYKNFKNNNEYLHKKFDVVNWNPYWDGVWNFDTAKKRFQKYIN